MGAMTHFKGELTGVDALLSRYEPLLGTSVELLEGPLATS
jgi:hypothetical protein